MENPSRFHLLDSWERNFDQDPHHHQAEETTDLEKLDALCIRVPSLEVRKRSPSYGLAHLGTSTAARPSASDLRGPRPVCGQWRQFAAGGSPRAAEPSPADLFVTQPMNI